MNISDEAVEAAAKASHLRWEGPGIRWEREDKATRDNYLEDARLHLEAAAPYLAAQVWDEGFVKGAEWAREGDAMPDLAKDYRNPYRSQA